jgi:predicted Zn-dependent peptidase
MNKATYDQLQETLCYERLSNGLDVYILPKKGFQRTYATFSAHYGSIDNHFQREGGSAVQVPSGIAHFLEHKLFAEPDADVFSLFSQKGASVNAFTTFDRTTYLFSATEQIGKNLETLLDFVQHPYFTDENVRKEQGIIEQEIRMYQDNPDWLVYMRLIKALYHVHPVRIDIAGTIDSIREISKELLYECYRTFYHPENMLLFIVGGVDPEEMLQLVRDNQAEKSFSPLGTVKRFSAEEPAHIHEKKTVSHLPVSMPKCMFGFKEKRVQLSGRELLARECETKLMLELIFGSGSPLYQALYDEQLITDQFAFDFQCHPQFAFSVIGGETKDPEQLIARVLSSVEKIKQTGLDAEQFERIRKKKIGTFLRMLNSPEAIAYEFTRHKFHQTDLFAVLPIYESMTVDDVNRRMREHLDEGQMAVSIVESGGSE